MLLLGTSMLCQAQTEVTQQEARQLYNSTSKKRVSVHDPSVVYDQSTGRYYIFGSHRGVAWTTDMQNWTTVATGNEEGIGWKVGVPWTSGSNVNAISRLAFASPAVKTVKKGGQDVAFPQFNAWEWSNASIDGWDISGNLWAPDVVWNPTMQKWCMYMSVNGEAWLSSIVLLTADQIEGPYTYQGPVVVCGFRNTSIDFHKTDLELVIGEQTTLPQRYNRPSNTNGQKWGDRWPHTIDPAVFFDTDGRMWLVYGSWSGGIWMLELDETTGLRDYDVSYPSTNGDSNTVTSDPYFGKKIAGGLYVSGEGPYIERIGQYYYLFVSYGGFAPDGGYEMRVFRSENPDGPYVDAANRSAIFTSWVLNYGAGNDNRGEKIMGSYNQWGFQTVGECAQGHNSVIAADDGRTYLVYHTKFNDGTIGHQVRVHQLFLNENGWPVASPFEYNGETVGDEDMTHATPFTTQQLAGTYSIIVHKYKMDYANMEEVTPVEVTLTDDGKVKGAYNGTWSIAEGTAHITLVMGGTTYMGVVYEEQMDTRSLHAIAFTAASRTGVNVWGYKLHPKYAVAWQLNNQTVPVSNGQEIDHNCDLYGEMPLQDANVVLQWTSSEPDVISHYGRYNPTGLTENRQTTLTARLSSADYYWEQSYNVKALSENNATASADWQTGMVGHYGFDDEALSNSFDATKTAQLLTTGNASLTPVLTDDEPLRNGNVVQLKQGSNNKLGYVSMPNPLFGLNLQKGCTVSFYVKRADDNLWDALCGFQNGEARLYTTGNLYAGYNDGQGNWLDQNHPTVAQPTELSSGRWHLLTIVYQRTANAMSGGITMYVDGMQKRNDQFSGALADGTSVTAKQQFNYNLIVDHIASCPDFFLGNGSFWLSPNAKIDEVMFHDTPLSLLQVMALYQMTDRVHQIGTPLGIDTVRSEELGVRSCYDLTGRRLPYGPTKKGL